MRTVVRGAGGGVRAWDAWTRRRFAGRDEKPWREAGRAGAGRRRDRTPAEKEGTRALSGGGGGRDAPGARGAGPASRSTTLAGGGGRHCAARLGANPGSFDTLVHWTQFLRDFSFFFFCGQPLTESIAVAEELGLSKTTEGIEPQNRGVYSVAAGGPRPFGCGGTDEEGFFADVRE